jgi:spermidine synthase
VFNDGRNFLLTTRERFDVITADPIHPWFSGAGYLYTKQYFDLAASRLAPGGVMCQWLPIYELDGANLRSIVRTFRSSFAHVLVWLTHYDAHLVGSDAPFRIDERELVRRIGVPAVRGDLRRVEMGSARDLLAFFLFGTAGADAYAAGARLNTDDNLYLEFSAPLSIESSGLVAENFTGLVAHRESLLSYLAPADGEERSRQEARAAAALTAARIADPIRHRELAGEIDPAEAARLTAEFGPALGDYGPWRYLVGEFARDRAQAPRLLRQVLLPAVKPGGAVDPIRLGAVARRMTEVITTLDFVDGRDGRVLAHHEILGGPEGAAGELVDAAFRDVQDAYAAERRAASARGESAPAETRILERLAAVLGSRLARTDDAGLLVR